MKKFLVILTLCLLINPALASGVGYINYEKVAANYNFAQTSLKEIEIKGREFQQFLQAKENEFNKLETPLQKQKFQESTQNEIKAKEDAFNKFREQKEEQVYQRIYAVAEKIRLEKELDVLIDARGVFSGGKDISDELIQRLNHKK